MEDARILDELVSCPLVEEAGPAVLRLGGDPRHRRSAVSKRILDSAKKGRANAQSVEIRVDRDKPDITHVPTLVDGAGDKTYWVRVRLPRYQDDVGDLSRRATHAP